TLASGGGRFVGVGATACPTVRAPSPSSAPLEHAATTAKSSAAAIRGTRPAIPAPRAPAIGVLPTPSWFDLRIFKPFSLRRARVDVANALSMPPYVALTAASLTEERPSPSPHEPSLMPHGAPRRRPR